MAKTKVLIVDDHALVRHGLRVLLEQAPEVTVVGESGDGHDALQMTRMLRPDLVLMDICMPNLNGIDACHQITREFKNVKVLFLSMLADQRKIREAFKAGGSGFLTKGCNFDELISAINAAVAGQAYLTPRLVGKVMGNYTNTSSSCDQMHDSPLTAREREILQLISEGIPTKQIAQKLTLSTKTIETHRNNIMKKLDLHSVAHLTKYAINIGLTSSSV